MRRQAFWETCPVAISLALGVLIGFAMENHNLGLLVFLVFLSVVAVVMSYRASMGRMKHEAENRQEDEQRWGKTMAEISVLSKAKPLKEDTARLSSEPFSFLSDRPFPSATLDLPWEQGKEGLNRYYSDLMS